MNRVGIARLAAVATAALTLLGGGAAAAAPAADDPCTWGASSITAELVDGEWVTMEPQTSGCIPR